ncbi:MAG: peptide ABC transporter substrate-binding protein, partial [Chloroflexi bacterium]|nr:peptide ABC transporter substrate-binding protein [Chloroflexota bacterium]
QDSTSAEYVVHLFSGLVSLNAELEVVADLAADWDVDAEGRVYTFHLRPEATFADGKSIVASDLVYSLERACSPELRSPVGVAYLGDIVGVEEYGAGAADHIAGLTALDDHTLRVEIDAPKAYFLSKLTYPVAFVVDREQIEAEGDAWVRSPNGSGPFVLESLGSDRIVLRANQRYVHGAPAIERVEYILSGGLPITLYENDRLDIVGVSADEIERVLDPENPLYAEHRATAELSVQYLAFNVDVPPFDDVKVRQAFAHAIDKAKIADLVYKGTAVPAVGILPPEMPDYDESLIGLPYDPARARALLAESRYGSADALPKVVLAVSGSSGFMAPADEAVVYMIEHNLGIEIAVEQVDWPYFLRDLNLQRYQMFSSGWIADYPDSQNFLDLLFHSKSMQNHMGYANAEVDRLLEEARVESDPAERTALYRQAERIIVSEAPWVPLTHGVNHVLVKPYVKNYQESASLYPWMKDIRFED